MKHYTKIYYLFTALLLLFIFLSGCEDNANKVADALDTPDNVGINASKSTALTTTATINLSSKNIDSFKIANDGKNNSIGIASVGSDVYVFELEKGAAADSADIGTSYSITSTALLSTLRTTSGSTATTISNIEVNPFTKQVYILASNQKLYTLSVSSGTTSISAVNLSSVRGVKIASGTALASINDFAWNKAENRFYVSYGGTGTLVGAIAWLDGPFASDTTSTTYRQTIFTRSQPQFGRYTPAPIEKISIATINGKSFLTGENTCSPIFSEETAEIRKSTTTGITFSQTFNMIFDTPDKIFHHIDTAGTVYLMVIKDTLLSRIGQVFIDGTYNDDPANSNENTASRPALGPPPSDPLTQDEYKEFTGTVISAAPYGPGKVLVLTLTTLNIQDI